MTIDFRALVLSLPEATEKEAWGHPTFRVRNKMFATAATDLTTATDTSASSRAAACGSVGGICAAA